MAYSYKGSISFGLVYIPVTLHSAVKNNDIGFNMIDKKTMSRVRYKKTCEDCGGREVKQDEIVKGYEYEDGKYVIFDDSDFEKLKTKKDKNITIERFVPLGDVDPIYFDKPMLLYETDPFDDEDYIYELKLDGIRCVAYIEPKSVVLQNKRHKDVTAIYPELQDIKKCVKKRVILDGELVALTDGKPDFYALQKRALMSDEFKIKLAANKTPVQFVAYDILYIDGKDLTAAPLMKRKEILNKAVTEGHGLSISWYIERNGKAFFELAKQEQLEGIVAKKKDGLYYIGKRTHEWVKIKVMQDEDLFVCGYQPDENGKVKDLILGFDKYENAVWIKPQLIGTAHLCTKRHRAVCVSRCGKD